jgi:FkbM family methyltransferase
MAPIARRQVLKAGRLPLLNPLARAAVARLPADRREYFLWRLSRPGWRRLFSPSGPQVDLWDDGMDYVTTFVASRGIAAYEPDALPVAIALAKRAQTIIDVGANIGLYSLCMTLANPNAQIFAFEPVNLIYEKLVKNVVANGLTRVTCIKAAVGNTQELVPLFAPAADTLGSIASTVPSHVRHWPQTAIQCDFVAQTTLDCFARRVEIDEVDLVKIDVEQAELGVLEGMTSLLSNRPHIICEVLPAEFTQPEHAAAIADLVASHDYRVFLLTPDGPVSRPSVEPDEEHWNQLFTTMSAAELASVMTP